MVCIILLFCTAYMTSGFDLTSSFLIIDANSSSENVATRRNVSEDEALLFIGGRMTENEWSSTFK